MQIQRLNFPTALNTANQALNTRSTPASVSPDIRFGCPCCVPITATMSTVGLGFLGTMVAGAVCHLTSFFDVLKTHAASLFKPFIK